ncbi:hypothetical protein ABIF78_007694 [Bradyrhizobium japonicum]
MKKTALSLAAIVLLSGTFAIVLLSGSAHASEKAVRDWTDKSNVCDKDDIGEHMKKMAEQNILGPKVIYIKEAVEVARSSDELRCRIVVVHSRGKQAGIFRYHNEDGRELVQFKSGSGR